MQSFIHYCLHFGFPFIVAYVFFKKDWKKVYLLLIATMLVDLDHLVASPIFEANRCSINFHPLHTFYAMLVYFVLLFLRKPFNIIGIGLFVHMATDFIDCLMTFNRCGNCLAASPIFDLLQSITNSLPF
jgi:hypothetical protein